MTLWKNYYLAQTIPDAIHALATAPGPSRVISGGTDLLLDLQQGRHPPVHTLVDVTGIPEMSVIEIRREQLFIGAAVPLNRVVHSPLVGEHAPALIEACALIGGPQVRNTATVGGNVGHALPAGDGTIALLSLGALAEIADANGCHQVPLESLFLGPGRSALIPERELISGFYLPLCAPGTERAGWGSAFRRVMRPQGVAIAILNMGVWVERQGELIADVRIAIGPAGPVPFRARQAEQVLRDRPFGPGIFLLAYQAILADARFRSSPHRATFEYRQQMTRHLLNETLNAAWKRTFQGR
jgi:CO/xanthine dehydrogenase FAD-binding subunit